ncbi:DMT family transporter [Oceanobacillus halotolerans]|uniref:DMT family transporter n=1 Tax=Oceanobacillus halotolerans TaxID=2663380 RepID=UPI0013DC5702|nr:multidrug efflux SMR transporter [Oceanobacillus halotolerans]
MAWVHLFIASFGEIAGVFFINLYIRTKKIRWLLMVILSFMFGLSFLSLAMRDIPLGTAYAVWTGFGAAGTVLMGILLFREPADYKRLFFLMCIIMGAVGLRALE